MEVGLGEWSINNANHKLRWTTEFGKRINLFLSGTRKANLTIEGHRDLKYVLLSGFLLASIVAIKSAFVWLQN